MALKKGFILTLDLVMAVLFVFMVLSVSLYFIYDGSEISIPTYQLLTIGSDIVSVLDNEKKFDNLDSDEINTAMRSLLPKNYDMMIRLESPGSTLDVGDISNQDFLISGRRVAYTDSNTYLKITYFIWPK